MIDSGAFYRQDLVLCLVLLISYATLHLSPASVAREHAPLPLSAPPLLPSERPWVRGRSGIETSASAAPVFCAPPTSTPPICPLLEVHFYRIVSFGARRLSVVRNSELSAIREQLMYCINGSCGRYIDCCPLYGRCPLLGVSVNRGSTVFSVESPIPRNYSRPLLVRRLQFHHCNCT